MLTPKNNVAFLRVSVLVQVAKNFLENNLTTADELPNTIIPDDAKPLRGSLQKDRLIVKEQCMAAMGFTPCEEDVSAPLSEFAQRALNRQELPKATVSVLPNACDACRKTCYTVTDMCRGCVARPCAVNCPKKAITVENQAHINQDLCIKCGICHGNCPYNAINKAVVPCEDSCPVGAISKDENNVEHIDYNKCISCGKCLLSCPFGAIIHNSQIIDVLKAIKSPAQKTVAMLAPAVIGQFGNDIGKVIAAFKKLGFDEVVEVAQGADVTTRTEASEFIERMHEGAKFMTTSCCPAWIAATEKHIPEIKPFVSNTGSPMYYMAKIVKQQFPNCVSVFVGPCLAKRLEAEKNLDVDNVLVFEEAAALLEAANIKVSEMEAEKFAVESSAQSRRYPLSGGVAGAVAFVVGNPELYKPEAINGLNTEAIKKLKRYATTPPADFNMIEVMCCEGGCIAGPGTTCLAKKATVMVENYVKTSADIEK